jgi:ABC-2 type transport system permease protein
MQKLTALLYKDYLLLIRDLAGLAMMFLMPLALVVLMAYLQDSTFNSINESRVPLIILNEDKDTLGNTVERNIRSSHIFNVSDHVKKDQPLTVEALEKAVAEGRYQIGIIIPENMTGQIRQNVRQSVLKTFTGENNPDEFDSLFIHIYIDPTTKSSFRATLMSAVREQAASIQNDFIFKEITLEVNKLIPFPIGNLAVAGNPVQVKEQYAKLDNARIIPNSVQHNVPAWGMFAVFFIVVSLSGNIIKEREDGSFTRLRTMPCSYGLYIASKIIIYLIVCLLQLILMFIMGKYVLPLLGLPALETGHSFLALFLMCITASLAAIGYGIAIGKIAVTGQQAAIFGSISVVILAALGGIWIPTFIMPPVMQVISKISPLNWGLTGFYDIFVRDGDWKSVLPESLTLFLFFVICISIAIIYDKKKRVDI